MRAAKLVLTLAIFWSCVPSRLSADGVDVPRLATDDVQAVVDAFRARLEMTHDVTVTVVPANELLVSVETAEEGKSGFLLSLDDRFLAGLDHDELSAVVAHELGHVWIFTHHPYLQTERLANDIAMRLVSRDSLHRVYLKVWERLGTKGDLARFLRH